MCCVFEVKQLVNIRKQCEEKLRKQGEKLSVEIYYFVHVISARAQLLSMRTLGDVTRTIFNATLENNARRS